VRWPEWIARCFTEASLCHGSRVRRARNAACVGVLRRICWSAKKLFDRAVSESLFSGSANLLTFPQSADARHCHSLTGYVQHKVTRATEHADRRSGSPH
jgi:hypothetical protein